MTRVIYCDSCEKILRKSTNKSEQTFSEIFEVRELGYISNQVATTDGYAKHFCSCECIHAYHVPTATTKQGVASSTTTQGGGGVARTTTSAGKSTNRVSPDEILATVNEEEEL